MNKTPLHIKVQLLSNALILLTVLGTIVEHKQPSVIVTAAVVFALGANFLFFLDSVFFEK